MAPKYKLIYFDTIGAAESIRYIFAYANQEYEDVRISREQWPQLKDSTPFGKIPVLEIDGKQIPQSMSIARYLARQFNLAGKDEWEALQCDYLVDTLGDLKKEIAKITYEPDPDTAAAIKKKVLEENFPFYLEKFETIIANNCGFTVGSQITWSDLVFAVTLSNFKHRIPDILNKYSALQEFLTKIHNLPSIKAWLERRPPSQPTKV